MSTDIPLRCICGRMKAVLHDVSPARANRNVCCCKGCRKYAHELGRASEILDDRGGTEVFQVSPRCFKFTSGESFLGVMQLSRKGALRWFASCCKTPLAHTLTNGKVPFMAINHLAVDRDKLEGCLDDIVGPIRATVNGHFSGGLAREIKATRFDLFKMMLHVGRLTVIWMFRGEQRHSPFFDNATGAPVLPPPARSSALPRRSATSCG